MEQIKEIPDNDYTNIIIQIKGTTISFIALDTDYDDTILDTENEEFLDDLIDTFILFQKSLKSKPLSNYQH